MNYSMRFLQSWKLVAVLGIALSMGACASKNPLDGNAMASAATPGSQQDFVVNVGDRVFFENDQSDLTPQGNSQPWTGRSSGCSSTTATPSPSKVMPMSAALANTTLRSVRGAPSRSVPT